MPKGGDLPKVGDLYFVSNGDFKAETRMDSEGYLYSQAFYPNGKLGGQKRLYFNLSYKDQGVEIEEYEPLNIPDDAIPF